MPYETLVEASNDLYKKGYKGNFQFQDGKIIDSDSEKQYTSDQLLIVEQHRFEGMTNPSDLSILFAVEGTDGTKGLIISSYGAKANHELLEWMDQVKAVDSIPSNHQAGV